MLNRAVLFFLFLAVPVAALAVRLDKAHLARTPSDDLCNPGAAVTSFTTADTDIWLYVSVNEALANDVLRVEWVNPAGQVARTNNFNPLPSAGAYCFDAALTRASNPLTLTVGTWTVRGTWNGSFLFTLNFSVTAPGGGGIAVGALPPVPL